ncbi:TIM barrel protein [Yoonia sp.]|uniref:TIM barrel protein n=1 Tax=Yoonia sp. TaxID=2212373 RepID=UPI00358FF61B
MTAPHASTRQLFDVAAALGCVGVELRNDLGRALFDGEDPAAVADAAALKGLTILALAEVKAFNDSPEDKLEFAQALVDAAVACGAEAVALIPAVAPSAVSRHEQRAALRAALVLLQPLLETAGVKGLIEPLGFATSTLRYKEDVACILDEMNRPACFAIVHDTFHHHIAGETVVYPDLTGLVHISGVTDRAPAIPQMADAHRVLVDAEDRLANIGQLRRLRAGGYTGPASFEAFAPDIHDMKDPAPALAGSIAFINAALAEVTAGLA